MLIIGLTHPQDRSITANRDVFLVKGGEQRIASASKFSLLGQKHHARLEDEFQVAAQAQGPDDPGLAHIRDDDSFRPGIDRGLDRVGGIVRFETPPERLGGVTLTGF